MSKKKYITPMGLAKLKQKRNYIINKKPLIVKKIQKARALGDLRENVEYQIACEEQKMMDKEIKDINQKIMEVVEIDISKIHDTKVNFGAIVYFENKKTKVKLSFALVGEYESNIDNNLISISSPLGLKLLGKSVNDVITVGTEQLVITEILYDKEKLEEFFNKVAFDNEDDDIFGDTQDSIFSLGEETSDEIDIDEVDD